MLNINRWGSLFLLLLISISAQGQLHYKFDHTGGEVLHEEVSGKDYTVEYVFTDAKYKPNSEPLWRESSISGQSLLFDGYSTYIVNEDFAINEGKGFTVSVWVAPRAFEWGRDGKLSSIVNQQDLETKQGFAMGMHRHGSWSFHVGNGQEWIELWEVEKLLPKNEWSYLTATINQESVSLFLNGEKVQEKVFEEPFVFSPADEPLIVGRHNDPNPLYPGSEFMVNMFNGLMDDLKIEFDSREDAEIKESYQTYLNGDTAPKIADADIFLDYDKYEGDRFRPLYHAIAPAHWMNEPHAPFFFNGKYHLFYQHNPTGPYWRQIHWGHWVSDDMINWKHAPIALAPEKGELTPDGIWSGGAGFDPDGNPLLYFTAGNDDLMPNQAVAIAFPKDLDDPNLKEWEMHPELVAEKPEEYLENEFRDAFVWQDEDKWYMLVGTGLEGRGGSASLFESDNAYQWEYLNPFYISDFDKYPYLGLVWELPVFLPIGKYESGEDRFIFLISPVRDPADVEVFYWLGRFDKEEQKFVPDQEAPQLMDYGDFGFTGPSGMMDPASGKPVVFTIAQGKHNGIDPFELGWAHNAGLPVVLDLDDDGDLAFEPVPAIESLRGDLLLELENVPIKEANERLAEIAGDDLEILLNFASSKEKKGITVRKSPNEEELTLIYYNPENSMFGVDRTKSSKLQKLGIDEGELDLKGEALELRVFLDKSMLEIYANKRKSITTRVYAEQDATGLTLIGEDDLIVQSLKIWRMKPIDWQCVD
ncbi:GH32 C-terminal domain-containing protein [Litoribacter populi]|uniref:GH32 C-terminal domain-containing protein n=1 Tax=Litoribacter populi TaxID=2598460 RepID=UPI00117CB39A|nr:GH32 C-terminal domain-containing protein [Litoribacter populi]